MYNGFPQILLTIRLGFVGIVVGTMPSFSLVDAYCDMVLKMLMLMLLMLDVGL